jgi:hypothetical protein
MSVKQGSPVHHVDQPIMGTRPRPLFTASAGPTRARERATTDATPTILLFLHERAASTFHGLMGHPAVVRALCIALAVLQPLGARSAHVRVEPASAVGGRRFDGIGGLRQVRVPQFCRGTASQPHTPPPSPPPSLPHALPLAAVGAARRLVYLCPTRQPCSPPCWMFCSSPTTWLPSKF